MIVEVMKRKQKKTSELLGVKSDDPFCIYKLLCNVCVCVANSHIPNDSPVNQTQKPDPIFYMPSPADLNRGLLTPVNNEKRWQAIVKQKKKTYDPCQ